MLIVMLKTEGISKRYIEKAVIFVAVILMLCMGVLDANGLDKSKRYSFSFSGGTLRNAVSAFRDQAQVEFIYSLDLAEQNGIKPLYGRFTIEEALERLLDGSGLSGSLTEGGMIVITRAKGAEAPDWEEIVNKKIKNGLLASVSTLLFGAGGSVAQYEADEDNSAFANDKDGLVFEEVIVTASRREQNLQDVPMSVAVIDPIDLTAVGFTSIEDAIGFVPGFDFHEFLGVPRDYGSITARGIGQLSTTPVVSIYVDDMPLTSSGPSGQFLFFDGLLGDIERVEFLKGPQGTLYGASAMGGTIRYITKRPSLEEFRGMASVDFSVTEDGGLNQVYNGRISTPIVEDKLGITVAAYYDKDRGYVDLVDSAGNLLAEDPDRSEAQGFIADVLYQATDRLSLRLKYLEQESDFLGLRRIPLDENLNYITGGRQTTIVQRPSDRKSTLISGAIEYEFDWGRLTSNTGYFETDFNNVQNISGAVAFIDLVLGNPPGTTTSAFQNVTLASEKFVQEIRLTADRIGAFEANVGVYFADQTDFWDVLADTDIGQLILDFDNNNSFKELAGFGELTYYITDDLDVTGGVRISRTEHDPFGSQVGPFAQDVSQLKTFASTEDTYSLSIRYRPNEDLSLFTRMASGFLPPLSVPIARDFITGEAINTGEVDSDSLWSYEIGAKGTLPDARLSYELIVYYLDWQEFRTTISGQTASDFLGNADSSITVKGFEGTLIFQPVYGLSWESNFAYADSTLDEDDPAVFGLAGQQMPRIPEWTASSRIRYDFALTGEFNAFVGATARYTGSMRNFFDDGNTPSHFNIDSDAYTLVDFSAGVSRGAVAANIYVTNLFDDDTPTGLLTRGASTGNRQREGVPLRPRTIGLNLTVDF